MVDVMGLPSAETGTTPPEWVAARTPIGALARVRVYPQGVCDLVVYSDAIVLSRVRRSDAPARVASATNLVDALTSRHRDDARITGLWYATPEEVARRDDTNRLVRPADVRRAELAVREGRGGLALHLADGSTVAIAWDPGPGRDADPVALLGAVLGDRLHVRRGFTGSEWLVVASAWLVGLGGIAIFLALQ